MYNKNHRGFLLIYYLDKELYSLSLITIKYILLEMQKIFKIMHCELLSSYYRVLLIINQ